MDSTGERAGPSNGGLKRTAETDDDMPSDTEMKKRKIVIAAEGRNLDHRTTYRLSKLNLYKIRMLDELKKLDEREMELDDKAEERALNRYEKFRLRLLKCENLIRKYRNIARTEKDDHIQRTVVNNISVEIPGWDRLELHVDEFIRRIFLTKGARTMPMNELKEIIDKVKAVDSTYAFPNDDERLQKLLNWVNWQIRDASMIHRWKVLDTNLLEYPDIESDGLPIVSMCSQDPPYGEVSLQNRIFSVEADTPEGEGDSIPSVSEDGDSEGDDDELEDVESEDLSDDDSILDMEKYCAASDDDEDEKDSSTTSVPEVVNTGKEKEDSGETLDGGTSTDSPSPVTEGRGEDMPNNNIVKQNQAAATRPVVLVVPTVHTGPLNPPPPPVPAIRTGLDPRWALVLQPPPVQNVIASTILLSETDVEMKPNEAVDNIPHRIPIQGLPVFPKLNPSQAWKMKIAEINQWLVQHDFAANEDNESTQVMKRDDEGGEGDDEVVCIDDDFEFDSVSHSGLQFKRDLKKMPAAPVKTSDENSVIEL